MFQSFEARTSPETSDKRMEKLRIEMMREDVDGFLIPRADVHQGEYVTPRDQRLAWLTSFTGSAGYCAVLLNKAGLFVDGRYTLQAREQVDLNLFTPLTHPTEKLSEFLLNNLPKGSKFAFDPWLHTASEIEKLKKELSGKIELVETRNFVDEIWNGRPNAPQGLMIPHPIEFAGKDHTKKIKDVATQLTSAGQDSTILTQPDSIAWLLNVRGTDLGQTPVAQAFAVVSSEGNVDLFVDPIKVNEELIEHLGKTVLIEDIKSFSSFVEKLSGTVRIDRKTAPLEIKNILSKNGTEVVFGDDLTSVPKAKKNETEINGAIAAHVRDGAAVCNFLHWISDLGKSPNVSEIDVVVKLEEFRRETNALKNISFDTISGSGPNGAIVHYRVNEQSNRKLQTGDVLLVDSGAQYLDGTTDITRTVSIGPPKPEVRHAFTLVLKGMIAVSQLRFPKGLAGRDIDGLARQFLWADGKDFDHGTGHGVGSYLSVHEGPQGISKRATAPFEEGMIVSNEPGYYKEGDFGIRIENLIFVKDASSKSRELFSFETLTMAPIDVAMIDLKLLTNEEKNWLNDYHSKVFDTLQSLVSNDAKPWLKKACKPV